MPTFGPHSKSSDRCIKASEVRVAFSAIDQALVAIERNAGVKIVADWLVLQL